MTGPRSNFKSSCSPTAEARRRERRQCGCESRCEHHFLHGAGNHEAESLKHKIYRAPFQPPCLHGPKLRQRSSRLLTGIAGCMSLWTDHFYSTPVGETASRLAYIQKSRGAAPSRATMVFAAARAELLRSSSVEHLFLRKWQQVRVLPKQPGNRLFKSSSHFSPHLPISTLIQSYENTYQQAGASFHRRHSCLKDRCHIRPACPFAGRSHG